VESDDALTLVVGIPHERDEFFKILANRGDRFGVLAVFLKQFAVDQRASVDDQIRGFEEFLSSNGEKAGVSWTGPDERNALLMIACAVLEDSVVELLASTLTLSINR